MGAEGSGDDATFSVTVLVNANTLAFGGSVQPPDYGLQDLLEHLPAEARSFLGWIPNIAIDSVGVMFDPESHAFGVYATAGLADSAEPSAELFIGDVPVTTGTTTSTAFVVGISLSSRIELSGTPLFGSMLSGISISDLTFTYASADIPTGAIALPPPAPTNSPAYPQGPVLGFTLGDGTAGKRFVLKPSSASSSTSADSPAALGGDPPPPVAPIQWFDIQKTIGPLTLGRIGIVSGDDELGLALDAAVQTTALGVDLTGFTLFFKPTSDISLSGLHVSLDGLSVQFGSGSVSIAGSLVRTVIEVDHEQVTEYDGGLVIQAGPYGISAVASFAELHGSPSLFVFGMAKGQFGGVPEFFVTGIAAGFGYNRSLRLPKPEEVLQFPFVLMARQGSGYLPDPSAASALSKLSSGGWVPPELGSYWVAAGISFTSFELLDGFALLIVQFGNETVIALLGVASIALPTAAEGFAYAEMTLDAVLVPSQGTFQMTALLTPNSYVLYRDCRLTGGFAFYLWFGSNPHAGDFVVTLGGYNAAFDKPDWYPTVPRLGFAWNVSSEVHIEGGAYFAITPTCVMGGGGLALTFQSGDLKAWFDAHADFIMWWKPFYFDISIGVSIGASYTLDLGFTRKTLTVSLSADVELWGPPLAGVAHVSWYIISFTIAINGGGSPSLPGKHLDWTTFQTSFLPAEATAPELGAAATGTPSPVCRPRVTSGQTGTWHNGDDEVWLVSADALTLATETVVPASSVVVAAPSDGTPLTYAGPAVGVYPMGSVVLTSTHTFALYAVVGQVVSSTPVDLSSWTWTPVTGSVPYSLWGGQNTGQPVLASATVPALTGITGVPAEPVVTGPPAFPLEDLAFVEIYPQRPLPITTGPAVDGSTALPTVDPRQVVATTISDPGVVAARGSLAATLNRVGVGAGLNGGTMARLAEEIFVTFLSEPMLGPVGSTGPAREHPVAPAATPAPAARRLPRLPRPIDPPLSAPLVLADFRRLPGATDRVRVACRVHDAFSSVGERGLAAHGLASAQRIGMVPHTLVVVRAQPDRGHVVTSDGRVGLHVVAYDRQYLPISEHFLAAGAATSQQLAPGAERLVIAGLPVQVTPAPGWHEGARLLQVSPQALVGTDCLVRVQSPHRVRGRRTSREAGVVTASSLVDDNWTQTDDGRRPGWVDTWLPGDVRGIAASLRADDRLGASAAAASVELIVTDDATGVPRRVPLTSLGAERTRDEVLLLAEVPPGLAVAGGRTRVRVTPADGWTLTGVHGHDGDGPALAALLDEPSAPGRPATPEPRGLVSVS